MPRGSDSFAQHKLRFEQDFPFGEAVMKLLGQAGARPIWLQKVKEGRGAPARSWQIHVRLPKHLEEHFGITRQFLVYCACTDDLRPRDATTVQTLIRSADDPIEPDLALLVTDDPDAHPKLADWAVERELGLTIVPIAREPLESALAGEDPSGALRRFIEGWISAHDLYDERGPVTGKQFHGRAGILRDLDRKLAQARGHVGIFGLRRIGKTSLLLELQRRLAQRPDVVPVFIDLEGTSGAAHTFFRIAQEVADVLPDYSTLSGPQARRALNLPDSFDEMPPDQLMSRMADTLRNVLMQGALRNRHVILILDEVEILLPNATAPEPNAVRLFRALRAVSQETRRLSLVIAGVNATPTESHVLGDQDNPLFGLLSIEYLGPLEPAECDEMLRGVGRRMQVRWGASASELTHYVGAHPLLARLAASDVVTTYPERPLRPNIEQTRAVLEDFHTRRTSIFSQMVDSLRRYYPDELEVLRVLASGDQVFGSELVEEDPNLRNHLVGYGVLDNESLSIANPSFRRWLRGHSV